MQTTTRLGRLSFVALLLLGLTFSAPATHAAAKTVSPTQHEIQAVYNKINAALAQKDIDTAMDYDADGCEYYDAKGHLRDTVDGRQDLVKLIEYIDVLKQTTVITSFTGTNSEATVTVKSHTIAYTSNGVTGRAARVVGDDVDRDYWVKTDDGWRRKRSREIKTTVKLHKNF
ncbi:MAG: hypothetical protein ACRYFS_05165 [Janthinobacterium lividum]